jgi:hypothetical protein
MSFDVSEVESLFSDGHSISDLYMDSAFATLKYKTNKNNKYLLKASKYYK